MKFEIDFNREDDDKTLELIGATLVTEEWGNYYTINLKNFDDLADLLQKVNMNKDSYFYSAVVNFDPPTIYLDNDV